MSAYITVEFTPKNKELMQSYSAKAALTLADYQGEFLVKAPIKVLTGDAKHEYAAIIAFPTMELAENWYNSTAYQELINLRNQSMESKFLLLD